MLPPPSHFPVMSFFRTIMFQVTVHYPAGGRQPVATYKQAFTGPCTRHCINCFKVVEGAALPADAVLEGGLDLFCSLDCERLYYIRNSSSEILQAVQQQSSLNCQHAGQCTTM